MIPDPLVPFFLAVEDAMRAAGCGHMVDQALANARRNLVRTLRFYLGLRILAVLDQICADIDTGRHTDNHLRALRYCILIAKEHQLLDAEETGATTLTKTTH